MGKGIIVAIPPSQITGTITTSSQQLFASGQANLSSLIQTFLFQVKLTKAGSSGGTRITRKTIVIPAGDNQPLLKEYHYVTSAFITKRHKECNEN